jgi:hypothetical protein
VPSSTRPSPVGDFIEGRSALPTIAEVHPQVAYRRTRDDSAEASAAGWIGWISRTEHELLQPFPIRTSEMNARSHGRRRVEQHVREHSIPGTPHRVLRLHPHKVHRPKRPGAAGRASAVASAPPRASAVCPVRPAAWAARYAWQAFTGTVAGRPVRSPRRQSVNSNRRCEWT